MKTLTRRMLLVDGTWGTHIDHAIRDAIMMAVSEDIRVRLNFNETQYEIDPSDLIQRVRDHPVGPSMPTNTA